MLKTIVSTVIATPRRSGVCGSPAARNAPLSMKNIIMPMMPDEHRAQERQRLGLHLGRGVDQVAAARVRRSHPTAAEDDRHAGCGEERLVDDAIDLVGLIRAGESRHQHRHAGEDRRDRRR